VTVGAAIEKIRLKAQILPSRLATVAPVRGMREKPIKKPHKREQKSAPIVKVVEVR
jgi:hypothetical protein